MGDKPSAPRQAKRARTGDLASGPAERTGKRGAKTPAAERTERTALAIRDLAEEIVTERARSSALCDSLSAETLLALTVLAEEIVRAAAETA